MVLGQGLFTETRAVTIYSYIDDQGNPAHTDTPEAIPEKYRARVKTHEQPGPVATPPSLMQSVQQTVTEQAKKFRFKAPSFHIDMEGLTTAQSKILTYAGAAAAVLFLMMYLSKSQLVRTMSFCLLIVIGIGAPVLMYASDGGQMDAMKKKAAAAGQAQQDRLQQAPR
jgi:hypothetical protein